MKEKKYLKIFYNSIKIIIYIILLLLIIYIIVNIASKYSIFGYKAFIVVSDSMKPTINKGDLVIDKKEDENKINSGDIITFDKNKNIITHRVIKKEDVNGNYIYITKGDYNEIEDEGSVEYKNIEGVVKTIIPYIGYIMLEFNNLKLIIIIIIVILFLIYLRAKQIDNKNISRRKKKKIEDERNIKNNEKD